MDKVFMIKNKNTGLLLKTGGKLTAATRGVDSAMTNSLQKSRKFGTKQSAIACINQSKEFVFEPKKLEEYEVVSFKIDSTSEEKEWEYKHE